MVKIVPQGDAKSASMGWFFDPGFIQNVQRVAADIENPSMESIDSVLFALREMGYIKTAATCEHGFSVDECVTGMCELQAENAALLARHNALREAVEWERECRDVDVWMNTRPWSRGDAEIWSSLAAARAEVDRLLKEPTS